MKRKQKVSVTPEILSTPILAVKTESPKLTRRRLKTVIKRPVTSKTEVPIPITQTSVRQRTLTYVVTRISGNETIIASRTEIKPHTTTFLINPSQIPSQ